MQMVDHIWTTTPRVRSSLSLHISSSLQSRVVVLLVSRNANKSIGFRATSKNRNFEVSTDLSVSPPSPPPLSSFLLFFFPVNRFTNFFRYIEF